MKPTFISLILLLILVACHENGEIARTLDIAEQQMTERPDSSFQLLSAINPDDIHSRGQNARYALLLSQAMDKNYIDETNDSLISIALNYYDDSNPYYRFMSLYYYGRVQYNSGNYAKAILSYTEAEQYIEKFDNPLQKGHLYAHLGATYRDYYDYNKSLDAFKEALKYYKHAQSVAHQNYAIMDLGQIYFILGDYKNAENCLHKILDWSYNLDNDENNTHEYCIKILIHMYEALGKKDLMMDLYQSKHFETCTDSQFIHEGYAYRAAFTSNKDMVTEHIKKMWEHTTNVRDSIDAYYYSYRIYKLLNNYQEALSYYEHVFAHQDSITRLSLQQPLITYQRDYHKSEAQLAAAELKNNQIILIAVAVVALLLIIIVLLYHRHKIVVKDDTINRYFEAINSLRSNLRDKDNVIDDFEAKLRGLFSQHFSTLDHLSITYYESINAKKEKDAIYNYVKKEIRQINSRGYGELEKIVNLYKSDVMSLLRAEVDLAEDDYRLLCFIIAGFSTKAISVFTNNTPTNITTRKWRLKNNIISQNPKNLDLFIKNLS